MHTSPEDILPYKTLVKAVKGCVFLLACARMVAGPGMLMHRHA